MRELSMETIIEKLSQLYVTKFLEKQILTEKLNNFALSQLQNRSVSDEFVKLNQRLTESLLILEKLVNIFEQLGICDDVA